MATVLIELEIDGDDDTADRLVDDVLDNGTLQDAIQELADDRGDEIEVESAVSVSMAHEIEAAELLREIHEQIAAGECQLFPPESMFARLNAWDAEDRKRRGFDRAVDAIDRAITKASKP